MRHSATMATGRGAVFAAAGLAAGLGLAVLVTGGCTSDPANVVGGPLVEATFDTVLAPVQSDQLTAYTAFKVENENRAIHQQELLYMGEQQGTRSSILANFDFGFDAATVPRDTVLFPDSLFTLENIKTVKFSLVKPTFYQAYTPEQDGGTDPSGQPIDLYYVIQQLEAPFDSTAYVDYPNVVPPISAGILNSDFDQPNDFDEPFLRMFPEDFVAWFGAAEPIGLVIQLDARSDSGLVGFGSRDLKKFSEFSSLQVGTVVAPNFQVEFIDYVDTNQFFLMGPFADTSTFDQVPEPPASPADGIMLRTGMRSYPAVMFDYSGIPENARINRAVLELNNDPATSYGRFESLVVSELDSVEFADPFRTINLSKFREPDFLYQVSGRIGLGPKLLETLELEVTVAVQRYVNRVTEGTKGLIVTAGERPLTFSSGVEPDFYYRQFNFFGTAADEDLRPKLRVTYTLVDDLGDGGTP